jgi:hypothetical protein
VRLLQSLPPGLTYPFFTKLGQSMDFAFEVELTDKRRRRRAAASRTRLARIDVKHMRKFYDARQ